MNNLSLANLEDILSFQSEDFTHIREWLVREVDYLFHHDMEKLKWVLYRIDINEMKLKQLLINAGDISHSEIIAEEIITRQIQKYHSRKATEKSDWSFDV